MNITIESIETFIQAYKDKMNGKQLEMIERFKNDSYGFELSGYSEFVPMEMNEPLSVKYVFEFRGQGVRGQIEIFI